LNFKKSFRYLFVNLIKSLAVVYVSGGYFIAQYKPVFIAAGMRFVCKLYFMFPFAKYSAVWLCCGDGHFFGWWIFVIIIFVLQGLFAMSFLLWWGVF